MGKVIKFPDAGQFSFVYYIGMDSLLLTHRTSGESMWINGSDINGIEHIFRQVQTERDAVRQKRVLKEVG